MQGTNVRRRMLSVRGARIAGGTISAMFLVVAAAYWLLSYEAGGTTPIAMVGLTLGAGTYVLLPASPEVI